jgi:hypothetical protein
VADGAVSFYLDRLVSVRVARFDFGTRASTFYDPSTMSSRQHLIYRGFDGLLMVPNYFDVILKKVKFNITCVTNF